ncbi:hypothetical protein F4780DRAFT_778806 [Xylariomycetidae sp. FL0641]|nr:hypothetical protein F4780DRAFT_778806 [Xylariomycetidae sp. FL0641]
MADSGSSRVPPSSSSSPTGSPAGGSSSNDKSKRRGLLRRATRKLRRRLRPHAANTSFRHEHAHDFRRTHPDDELTVRHDPLPASSSTTTTPTPTTGTATSSSSSFSSPIDAALAAHAGAYPLRGPSPVRAAIPRRRLDAPLGDALHACPRLAVAVDWMQTRRSMRVFGFWARDLRDLPPPPPFADGPWDSPMDRYWQHPLRRELAGPPALARALAPVPAPLLRRPLRVVLTQYPRFAAWVDGMVALHGPDCLGLRAPVTAAAAAAAAAAVDPDADPDDVAWFRAFGPPGGARPVDVLRWRRLPGFENFDPGCVGGADPLDERNVAKVRAPLRACEDIFRRSTWIPHNATIL